MNIKFFNFCIVFCILSLVLPIEQASAASVALPTITISAATSITSSAATLNGKITAAGGDNPTVTVYWGTTDGAKTASSWTNNSVLASQGVAAFTKNITGLNPGTKYYFSASAANSAGTAWPSASLNFTTTVALPTITLSAATNIATTTATLNGNITATGGANPTVTVYWGTTDGGQTAASWTSSSALSSQGVAAFTKNITSLSPGTTYYFTAKATNSAGTSWPAASLSFATTVALPTITISAATSITSSAATLNGKITAAGGDNPTVTVYWGTTDGAKTASSWTNNSVLASQGVAAFTKNITGLNPGTKYYFSASAANSAGTAWPSASLNFTTTVALPTITLSAATNIATTTATLNGNITATGGANPTVTVYWGTTDGGQTAASWTSSSALSSQGVAAFTKNITSLSPGTTYYFTAKATNSAGTSWPAASLSFATTVALPTITISAATSITSSAATLNGKITAAGGDNPTVTVYWGTTDGAKTASSWTNNSVLASQGVAAFTKNITGLNPGTKYYFSASAANSAGTAWPSASLNFTTTVALPTITLSAATNIATTTATLNGNITATGGANPTVTVYWGTTDGGQTAASWTSSSALSSQGVAAFTKNITSLSPGTTYYFTAKATNSAGTSWPAASLSFATTVALPTITISAATSITSSAATLNGKITAAGGDNPTVTVYWGTTDGAKTASSWTNNSVLASQGVAAFTKNITGLNPGTKYYFSASAANSAGTAWPSASLNFTTTVALPTITLSAATNIATTTATLNGNITATGGANPTVTVYWGTTDGGQTAASWTSSSALSSQGVAAFTKNITSLSPGTTYYFTAKATNSAGTSWPAASLSFATTVALPTITISAATSITSSAATLNGKITAAGGDNPTVTVYWGTTDGAKTASSWTNNSVLASQGVAAFTKNITGLNPGTKYYFSASAANSAGTAWPSASLNFTTTSAPVISISVATKIISTSATLNGNITAVGKANPTVTVYWGTTDGGQTSANWQNSSAPTSPSQPQGVAAFYKNLIGLSPGTTYYFTAKATNSAGTSWPAASLSFATLAVPAITISDATSIETTTATLNGTITANGGANPTVTMYWGTTDGGQTPASWQNSSAPTSPSQPQVAADFYKDVTSLSPGTKYYFSASATNLAGTSWPTVSLSFTTPALAASTITISAATSVASTSATLNGNITAVGGDNPTVTVYWGTTDGGQTSANWQNSSAPTSPSQPQGVAAFYKNLIGLSPGTTYYFTAKATNSAGDAWPAASLSFTTLAASTVTLSAATNVATTTATLNGNVTATLNGTITANGGANPTVTMYWGTTDGGQTPASWQNSSAPTSPSQPQVAADFYKDVTSLSPGTKYYFSASATNLAGTSWPTVSLSFTTPALAASTITISAATSVASTSATLNGNITAVGGDNPTVTVYWGTTDGGQTSANWQNSSAPTSPSQPQGVAAFYKNLIGLSPGTTYYFTAKATNSAGDAWPAASLSFTPSSTSNLNSIASYILTITPNDGVTMGSSFSSSYSAGSVVTFTAIPTTGYVFSHWSGDVTGNVNPIHITMDSDKSIIANFVPASPTSVINLNNATGALLSGTLNFLKRLFTFNF